MGNSFIEVQGAKEHNLKNVSIKVPRNSLSVFTGVSGSGKSSLVYDTIFQEGQRRFTESLSAYARQFLGQMEKPQVDHIEGLSPTVSIDQRSVSRSRRSTVGTITEVYDFYRVLFARLGTPYCVKCNKVVNSLTKDEIFESILNNFNEAKIILMAPVVRHRKGEYRKELKDLQLSGYQRVRVDGKMYNLDENIELGRYENHTIEVVIDRLVVREKDRGRLSEAIESCLKLGKGVMTTLIDDKLHTFSTVLGCIECGTVFQELEPRLFSFNTPWGACEECNGLGETERFDERLVIPDESKSVNEGAFICIADYERIPFSSYGLEDIKILAGHYKINLDKPWKNLKTQEKEILLYGSKEEIAISRSSEKEGKSVKSNEVRVMRGVMDVLARVYHRAPSPYFQKFLHRSICKLCNGARLNESARSVRFREFNIIELAHKTVQESLDFFAQLKFSVSESKIATALLKEIKERLIFLQKVGLHYLNMDRDAASLSGGEAQRIRLAKQVGSKLSGVLYILDEPSIGLHQRDNKMLIDTLKQLRDLDNTVLVIEHDEETMENADFLVDVGPGAGVLGGEIVAAGTPFEVSQVKESVTGQFLAGAKEIAIPKTRRKPKKWIELIGAKGNNLKNISVKFPMEVFSVITGVSGSGKSTLVLETLEKILHNHVYGINDIPAEYTSIKGIDLVDKVINIDQSPIGRTPRSNPATYTKVFDLIRTLFSNVPEAKLRGYKPGRFSFNVPGGRCEICSGYGEMEIEMQFLSNVHVPCDECLGKRYSEETLEIYYRGKNIFHVLDMSIAEAVVFFENHPQISKTMKTLMDVGLGYIKLGQSSTTLSGGEAQRVKLASELRKIDTGNTVYIMDEPTTGLHFTDIDRLLGTLQELVNRGNTVIVIEHNLDVIKCADYLIDLGPDGGKDGGEIIAVGTPEEICANKKSETGKVLKEILFRKQKDRKLNNDKNIKVSQKENFLEIEGACENNLKNISVKIPKNELTVITGRSGSGKSSLAMDTIFKEGQARYVESLSTYARQFLGKNEKANVKNISGLAPAIAVDQKNVTKNPRSTVATTTEIYDYLRLLYARAGEHHCPVCQKLITPNHPDSIFKDLVVACEGEKGYLLAPLFLPDISLHLKLLKSSHIKGYAEDLKRDGYQRVLIDNQVFELEAIPEKIKDNCKVYLIIDRISVDKKQKKRFIEAVETAFDVGVGLFVFMDKDLKKEFLFSRESACIEHDFFVPKEINPRHFSFNSHWGACSECHGLGVRRSVATDLVVVDETKSVVDGAFDIYIQSLLTRQGTYYSTFFNQLCKVNKVNLKDSFQKMQKTVQKKILYGDSAEIEFTKVKENVAGSKTTTYSKKWEGLLPMIERMSKEAETEAVREKFDKFYKATICPNCNGSRLSPFSANVRFGGLTIQEFCARNIDEVLLFIDSVKLSPMQKIISAQVLKEIKNRMDFLKNVGLAYLELNRSSATLSGGESQRIRLASQLGNKLQGVIYVLDEPTIGLHQVDTLRLIKTLKEMRDLGNTVLVVEHDEDVMQHADNILDMGPGAGIHGGNITYFGKSKNITKEKNSLTGAYLSGKKGISYPRKRREIKNKITLTDVKTNNLKNISVEFPLQCLTVVTGVSGSGKSSLAIETLPYALGVMEAEPGATPKYKSIKGIESVESVQFIDQSAIGASPSSTPATYTGVFDFIRDIYAATNTAKIKGYLKGRFSFNTGEGRCSVCEGKGAILVQMHFLADVWMECEQCRGLRFNAETLAVKFKDKNISDILNLTVEEAFLLFTDYPKIRRRLQGLMDVGLEYLKMGQSSISLSGGESQRMKLAAELYKSNTAHTLYILDEPTTGQHFDDINKLVAIFQRLVNEGHTLIVVEHNLDVIKNADYIIDLGPEGGKNGGQLLFQGTPENLIKQKSNATGQYLKEKLK
jgi:excinuclease ABC subunit A